MVDNKEISPEQSDLRRQAENLIAGKDIEIENLAPQEARDLLHDLQVHQIELEMQNDELYRAQHELILARDKYSDLYDFAPVGYLCLDKEGYIEEANLTLANLLGTPRAALLGEKLITFIHRDDRDAFYKHTIAVSKSMGPEKCELRMLDKDRGYFYAHLESLQLNDIDGHPSGSRTVISDISDRKRIERALKRERDNMVNVFENMSDGVYVVDHNNHCRYANKALIDEFGPYEGKKCYEYFSRKKENCPFCKIPAVFAKEIVRTEWYCELNGKTYDLVGTSILSPEGEAFRLEIFRDITERKKMEEELRKNEEKFSGLYAAMSEGVALHELVYDGDGIPLDYRIIDVNPAYEDILHLERSEVLGRKATEVYQMGEPPFLETFAAVAETGESKAFEIFYPPQERYFQVSVFSPERGKFATVFSDITERKRMENDLQKSREELEIKVRERTRELELTLHKLLHVEKLSAIGKFSASIAHEINNPLFGIRNVIEGLRKNSPLNSEDLDLADMALKECDRIKNLIMDLQNFNRPSTGVMAPLDIHEAIDSILLLTKKEFKNKNIEVRKEYDDKMVNIIGINDQLKQVILNLLNNAADAIPEGGGRITLSTELIGKNVSIKIQDSGKGISPEVEKQIFEPFFSTKSAVKGTGLGLSVCYGIVTRHGGSINFTSTPDQGTIFNVVLPVEGPPNG